MPFFGEYSPSRTPEHVFVTWQMIWLWMSATDFKDTRVFIEVFGYCYCTWIGYNSKKIRIFLLLKIKFHLISSNPHKLRKNRRPSIISEIMYLWVKYTSIQFTIACTKNQAPQSSWQHKTKPTAKYCRYGTWGASWCISHLLRLRVVCYFSSAQSPWS